MFIKSRMYMDDEYVVMTRNYFLQYTQLEILEFCDTLIQHMESVKKSIDERALHKREYDIWVNERQMQTTEDKVDSSKALDASLVDTESSGTTLKEQDTSSRSGNDAHADDADIRPIYDEEPMAACQTRAKIPIPNKTTKKIPCLKQTSFAKKPERTDPKKELGLQSKDFRPFVHEETMIIDLCLKWKPPGKISDSVLGGFLLESSELRIHDHNNELSSSKLVPKVVPLADKTTTSRQELELLFHHHIMMLRSTA
ncbi:hypothetical protein Tco_1104963 [Tanacetum coccineum]